MECLSLIEFTRKPTVMTSFSQAAPIDCSKRRWASAGLTAVLTLVALLSACALTPPVGKRFVMVVTRVPATRQELQYHAGLSLALERGVSREMVKSGRLVYAGCYFENAEPGAYVRLRHGYVLLPEGAPAKGGDIIEIAAEAADSTDGPFARFYGEYLGRSLGQMADYFPYKYSVSGKAFQCEDVAPNGRTRVEVYGVAAFWDFDLASAEASRNRQITDEDLRLGRIAMGECSPGLDSWVRWKVRLPDGLAVKKGDYLEAIAGAEESPGSTGALSLALRKVAGPAKAEFIKTQGSFTVACSAASRPLPVDR